MTLKFSTSGRPMIECINPECGKLHAIHRRGDYVKRAQIRVVCRGCGTKWSLNDEDTKALQAHYEERQKEIDTKKREKTQQNHEKIQKNNEIHNHPNIDKSQKELDKTRKTPSKKGFFDELLSL
jgi:uncharacterized Zn finger protein (UPF0148 family)